MERPTTAQWEAWRDARFNREIQSWHPLVRVLTQRAVDQNPKQVLKDFGYSFCKHPRKMAHVQLASLRGGASCIFPPHIFTKQRQLVSEIVQLCNPLIHLTHDEFD